MINAKRSSSKAASSSAKKAKKTPNTEAPNTKMSQLETILRRPEGATIAQLAKALDWQAHSIRGAMSGFLKKKRGLKIAGEKTGGKERVYRIVE